MAEVSLERADGVAVITLDAPARRNALTPEMAEELISACDEVDHDRSIGAAVIRGAEGHFCSGAHRAVLASVGQDPSRDDAYASISGIYDSFVRVGELGVPTIAAVRGAVVGAGMNLMLATDLRIVATDARLLSGFLRIGVHPGGGHFALLARAAVREVAGALGLFGEEIHGARAAQLGLAWQDVPDEQVEPRALELAVRVAADPPLARAAVASLRDEAGPPIVPWSVGVQTERARQMWSMRRAAERTQAEGGPANLSR